MTVRQAFATLAIAAAFAAAPVRADVEPESAPGSWGFTPKPGWVTQRFAVAAANPLAADAGYQVIKAGGTAVDAAVAIQAVLALVEPQSSGLGGGAFLLHFDGREALVYDGRETAPAAAGPGLFLRPTGEPMPFDEAVVGGRAVGVPGAISALELAHKEHGKLPWASLFEPAIALAQNGFRISLRLHHQLADDKYLRKDPIAAALYYDTDGSALAAGTLLKNPALAFVLRRIAREGSAGLLRGEVGRTIVEKVGAHPTNPGLLSESDLANYQPRKRVPLCQTHVARGKNYRICGVPPPNSGAIAIAQMLGMLAHTDAGDMPLEAGLPSADWLHLYTEAARLAFADRAQYVADPDFVSPPAGDWNSLLTPAYLAQRARLIDASPQGRSMKTARPGEPGPLRTSYAPSTEQPEHGTSHFNIVDTQGRAVAMTTSVESQFGSRLMVGVRGLAGGFLLNNQLTDFSFRPTDTTGRPVANAVQPSKRPRSSMSPTMVFDSDSGRLVLAAGSMGGPSIIHSTFRVLYGLLHWELDPQRAIDLPNFASYNGPTLLEARRFPAATIDALRTRGAVVREEGFASGAHAIQVTPTGLLGGADPRREGVVRGD